nr:hypothetical protein [Tanacetum cinerariifolium]
ALVSCDGLSGYDWSDQAEDGPTNFALMAYSSTSSNSKIIDKCKTGLGYNVVPPSYTGNFLPLKPDLSSVEELVNEPIISEAIVKKPVVETSEAKTSVDKPKDVRNNFGSPLIEDWISDSEDKAELKFKIKKEIVKTNFAKIKGHFARECRALKSQDTKHKKDYACGNTYSAALVSCDGLSGYDWSDQAEDGPTNFALMAYSSTSSNSKV